MSSRAQAAAQEAKTVAAAQPEPQIPQRAPTSNNAFNPGIAAVLNGFYVAASHDPTAAKIPGFALGDEAHGPVRVDLVAAGGLVAGNGAASVHRGAARSAAGEFSGAGDAGWAMMIVFANMPA